ncbi:MAG: hypothetical protein U0793_18005 [Gemmataceae bacterium]
MRDLLLTWIAMFVIAPTLHAQTAEVREERIGGRIGGSKGARAVEINRAMCEAIVLPDMADEQPLGTVLTHFQKFLLDRKLVVEWVVDQGAFSEEDPEAPPIKDVSVRFPAFPRRMALATALRMALDNVPTRNATYWVRRGQILLTTCKRVLSILDEPIATINVNRRPLAEALDELAESSGVTILLDPRTGDKRRARVSADLHWVRPRTAALLLADQADLKVLTFGNVLYVTTPKNAGRLKRAPTGPRGDERRGEGTVEGKTFREKELGQILDDLKMGDVVLDARVKTRLKTKITATFINPVRKSTAFGLLADMARVEYVLVDGVGYVTSVENAAKLRAAGELTTLIRPNARAAPL